MAYSVYYNVIGSRDRSSHGPAGRVASTKRWVRLKSNSSGRRTDWPIVSEGRAKERREGESEDGERVERERV